METKCNKGERVLLTDSCGQSFLGFVKSVNYDLGRIVLSDIIQLPEHKLIIGYRNFDKNEIIELKKYEADEFEYVALEAAEEEQEEKQPNTFSQSKINELQKFQSTYCYIKEYGMNFNSAIASLRSCDKVGLYASPSKGRSVRASLVAVSTPSKVFIFDFQTLGDDVLHKGLKEILESSTTIKVVHDCRLLSDCFKHKHLINLEGVRDVEAEDIMLVYHERKMIRKHSRPLEYLIKVHLGMEVAGFDAFAGTWDDRPLPPGQLEALVALASLLVPLQEAIQQKYLQRLLDASSVYNAHVRSLDFFDFLHQEPEKTLRNEMIKLVICQTQVRANCKKTKLDT